MSTIPFYTAVRIIPREADFLARRVGSRGEIFFDRDSNTLRLYDGTLQGGTSLAKNDLTNVSNSVFAAKATAAGVGGGGGGSTTVSVGSSLPSSPSNGNLWLNTNNGSLYVYINDGDSNQWIQPAVPTLDLTPYATKTYVDSKPDFEFYIAADDSTQIRINTGNVVQFIGAGGVTTSSDADGNITITGGGSTGNVTFSTTTIDTTDSSAITFTPAVSFDSDVIVGNDLKVDRIDSIDGITPVELLSDINFNGATSFVSTVTIQNSLFVSVIDTVDSASITVIPVTTFNSDVIVENELIVNRIPGYVSIIELKNLASAAADFSEFQTLINQL